MPRIDPLQLLKCLSVLLSPEGGILSRNEVPRLVSLMTKFSKKLVSKCVYVLILKNTETSLVDMFMAENGWTLVQSWLQDAVPTGNWVLVKEILELLLVTPVDVDRLKLNHLPKLIKSLTRKEGHPEVARLSDRIVQNWLMIVKGSASSIAAPGPALIPIVNVEDPEVKKNEMDLESVEAIKEEAEDLVDGNIGPIKTDSFYKITVKDGKQVIRKLSAEKDNEKDEIDKKNDKEKSSKSSSSSKPSSSSTKSSSSSSKSSSSSSSRDKERNKSSSRSGSSSSKSGSSSRDKSRDKDRDRKDKDRKSSSSKSSARSSHSSSSSKSRDKKDSRDKSKDPKETQSEKDKDALDKLLNPKPFKSARIPKLSSNDKPKENKPNDKPKENKSEAEVKKPSYSILNRKSSGEERGKTVKVFNSKMRSTGLEEIAKPPPKRSSKKPTPSIQLPTIPSKRPSPPRDSTMVSPEKKIKIDKVDKADRPGAIKLIAPKPKRLV